MLVSLRARLALVVLVAAVVAAAPAVAQDPIGGFFRSIFGGGAPPPPPPPGRLPPGALPPGVQVFPPGVAPPPGTVVVKPRVEPKIVEGPKNPDASVVAVIGDQQAAHLVAGFQLAFADTPTLAVSRQIKPGMSLVRDQDYDWPTQLPALIAESRADILVVMIGVNDRVAFPVPPGQKAEDIRSPKWEAQYRERGAKFLKMLKETGKPVLWVGQAPVDRPTQNGFLDYLNGLHKSLAEAGNVPFVSVWNGFTDDEGEYATFGADVDGKEKRLRADDGVGFTRAGQRKLAYFAEQDVRSAVRDGLAPEVQAPEVLAAPLDKEEAMLAAPPPLPPAPWKRVGPVRQIGDNAPPAQEADLAGAPPPVARPGQTLTLAPRKTPDALPGGYPVAETPFGRRFLRGDVIPVPAGRADDFRFDRASIRP